MWRLEVEVELDANAMAVGASVVTVSETPDVIDPQDGEDVVKAHTGFHIGLVAHGLARDIGREEEDIL